MDRVVQWVGVPFCSGPLRTDGEYKGRVGVMLLNFFFIFKKLLKLHFLYNKFV